MDRPYVICFMLSSVDGKITGDFMRCDSTKNLTDDMAKIRNSYNSDATLYGTTTMYQTYAEGVLENVPKRNKTYPREDYVAQSDVHDFIIAVDSDGIIAYNNKYIEKRNRPRKHVIEILSDKVSDDYIAYLRDLDISYIFAGKDSLDCKAALKKLKELFGIEKILMCGGGYVNWSFLQEGMFDELSLIISPSADGNHEAVSVFEKMDFLPECAPAEFKLKNVSRIGEDGIWLEYVLKREEEEK